MNRLLSPIRRLILKYPKRSERVLEILPGFVSWSLILFPVWGSFFWPIGVAYYIIAFDVYWFYRSMSMGIAALVTHFRIKAASSYDWMGDVNDFPGWEKVRHAIVIPNYNEPTHLLERALESLVAQTFPSDKIIPIIACEERAGKELFEERKRVLKDKFEDKFDKLMFTLHPADIEGEVAGKSANAAWASKKFREEKEKHPEWKDEYMTISSMDMDMVYHPNYFANLTYNFLDNPDRYRRIWQGAIVYYNNIDQIPGPMRVFNRISSIFQMALLVRQDRLINFSTYSMSVKLMEKVGYWDADVIPEDYRMFFKSYFATGGEVEVEPIFLIISGDAAESHNFWGTFKNTYTQVKRWAWGASDDAYILKNYFLDTKADFVDKTVRVFKILEDHFLWPVNWFIVTLGATLPPLLNEDFSRTIIGKTLPQIASAILTVSMISLVASLFVEFRARPDLRNSSLFKKIMAPLELILLPFVGLFFSALPGLEAHTRLMLGKYIEYRVTEKV